MATLLGNEVFADDKGSRGVSPRWGSRCEPHVFPRWLLNTLMCAGQRQQRHRHTHQAEGSGHSCQGLSEGTLHWGHLNFRQGINLGPWKPPVCSHLLWQPQEAVATQAPSQTEKEKQPRVTQEEAVTWLVPSFSDLSSVPLISLFPFLKFLKYLLFIYLSSCTWSWLWHVGTSSLTRDRIWAP